MNIVLVCINNFQEYILDNIQQLINLKHENIYVLTNEKFFTLFNKFSDKIKLISVGSLPDTFNYYSKTSLDKEGKGGFWALASLRFFYIYEFMNKYAVKDVIHLENDVLIYYNCKNIIDNLEKQFIYLPFDTFKRNIASIMYIPSREVFKRVLDHYNIYKNDMENFSIIQQKTKLIQNLPIFPYDNHRDKGVKFVSTNFGVFNFIFDAAAIGQFVGGIDPRNDPRNTIGYVNETSFIKYNIYKIWFENDPEDGLKKPYIEIDHKKYRIYNLHIHSKHLKNFV
jgi:hypothetical protein